MAVVLACFALLLCSIAAGDVVFFVDDNIRPLEGTVTEAEGKLTVKLEDGTELLFESRDVREIVKGKTKRDLYLEKLAAADWSKLESIFELSKWCTWLGLPDEAALLQIEILRRDPDNEAVHKALGHVLRNGRWVSAALPESFGEEFKNDRKPGDLIEVKGRNFVVVTDTSEKFGKFVADYLDTFADAVEKRFKGRLSFKTRSDKPRLIIYSDHAQYQAHWTKVQDAVLPRGLLPIETPRERDKYNPDQFSCFYSPNTFELVVWRYDDKAGRVPLRRNVQLLAGYGLYSKGLGGYRSMFKNPRFIMEGFGQALADCTVENGDLIFALPPADLISGLKSGREQFDHSSLFKIDPLAYFEKDTASHRALSWAFARFYFETSDRALSAAYVSLVKKDVAGAVRIDDYRALVKNYAEVDRQIGKFVAELK
jgi:hypothetical protein